MNEKDIQLLAGLPGGILCQFDGITWQITVHSVNTDVLTESNSKDGKKEKSTSHSRFCLQNNLNNKEEKRERKRPKKITNLNCISKSQIYLNVIGQNK